MGKYRLEEGLEVKISPGNIQNKKNKVISLRTKGGEWVSLTLTSFFILVNSFYESENLKYGPKSNDPLPKFFFEKQLKHLAEGKPLDPETFPGEMKTDLEKEEKKIKKIVGEVTALSEYDEKIVRVKAVKRFEWNSPTKKINSIVYERGDIVNLPKSVAKQAVKQDLAKPLD